MPDTTLSPDSKVRPERLFAPPRTPDFCPGKHCARRCDAITCHCPVCRCNTCSRRRFVAQANARHAGHDVQSPMSRPRLFAVATR